MGAVASQITSLTIVYSTVYSDADQRKHQSSASLAFLQGIHRTPVNSPHKWLITRKMFPFDDVIMHQTHAAPVTTPKVSHLPSRLMRPSRILWTTTNKLSPRRSIGNREAHIYRRKCTKHGFIYHFRAWPIIILWGELLICNFPYFLTPLFIVFSL